MVRKGEVLYRYLAALFCALVVGCGGAPEPAVDSMPAAKVPAPSCMVI